jgi:Fe-S cluster assembly scaffold protein SufB
MIIKNEPKWLIEYRERNKKNFINKPLKKSQYFDPQLLDKFLVNKKIKTSIKIPKEIENENISVLTWNEAITNYEQEMKYILFQEEIPKTQYESFINAYFNDGFIIIINGTQKNKNLIRYSIEDSKNNIIKNIIIANNKIENVNLLEDLNLDIRYLNETLYLKEGSKVVFCRRFNINNKSIINQQNILEKDACLKFGNAFIGGEFVRSRIVNSLNGSGSNFEELDFSFLMNNQFYDIDMISVHNSKNSNSNTILKTILNDSSISVFDGMIKIMPQSQKANALLQTHSMLLSKSASANNIPSLEIEANDIKATHSATSFNLDESQMFYLQSRGLDNIESKKIIINGFLEGIIYLLPEEYHELLSETLYNKVDRIKN